MWKNFSISLFVVVVLLVAALITVLVLFPDNKCNLPENSKMEFLEKRLSKRGKNDYLTEFTTVHTLTPLKKSVKHILLVRYHPQKKQNLHQMAELAGVPCNIIDSGADTWFKACLLSEHLENADIVVVVSDVLDELECNTKNWWSELKITDQGSNNFGVEWYNCDSILEFKNNRENLFWPLSLPSSKHQVNLFGIVDTKPTITPSTKKAYKGAIPNIIHQTWKSLDQLTPNLKREMEHVKNLNTDFEHRFYNDQNCREFISRHFDARILQAYDILIPGAFKADLWRLCILHSFGGVYLDIDLGQQISIHAWLKPIQTMFLIKDDINRNSLFLFNAVIAIVPEHPLMKKAIYTLIFRLDMCQNKRKECTKFGPLCVTGPGSLGDAFENGMFHEKYVQGFVDGSFRHEADRNVTLKQNFVPIMTTKHKGWKRPKSTYHEQFLENAWINEKLKIDNFKLDLNDDRKPSVIDVVMYNGEIDILNLRLNTLTDVVDKFVIVESELSFSGKHKELRFPTQKVVHRNKIRYISFPASLHESYEDGWKREYKQKNDAFLHAILLENAFDDDYVIFTDCDEIPNPKDILEFVQSGKSSIMFKPAWFNFGFHNYLGDWTSTPINVATVKEYRKALGKNKLYKLNVLKKVASVKHGGWHCSYFFKEHEIKRKLTEYSHAQDKREKKFLKNANIQDVMNRGGEIFKHKGKNTSKPYYGTFPEYVSSSLFRLTTSDEITKTMITIWIGGKSTVPNNVMNRMKSINQDLQHVHYDDALAHNLIKNKPEYVHLFNSLKANKYKADLLRMVHLWLFGGYYVDVDVDLVRPLRTFCLDKRVTFYTPISVCNGNHLVMNVLFCKPKHPIIKNALDLMVAGGSNFEKHNHHPFKNHPTNLMYQAVSNYLKKPKLTPGVHNDVQLDKEYWCKKNKRHGVKNKRGLMYWSRIPNYNSEKETFI